jgi:hypothetical protein
MAIMTVVHFTKVSALYPQVVISSLAKWLEKHPSCHSYTSFGAWFRGHYMLLQRFTTGVCHVLLWFPDKRPRLQCWGFPHIVAPFAPCGSCSSNRMSQRLITKIGAIPTQPSTTQHIAYLISKQAFPYRTCAETCWSLVDSSMTNHITWWIPTVSTIPNFAQTTVSNLTTVTSHHNRWKTNTLNTQHKPNSTS